MTTGPYTGRDNAWSHRLELRPTAWYVLCELVDCGEGPLALTSRDLAARVGLGRDSVRAALRELERAGLITRVSDRDGGGRFGPGTYLVAPAPAALRPAPENPTADAPRPRPRHRTGPTTVDRGDQLSLLDAQSPSA